MRRDIAIGIAWFVGLAGFDAATSAAHLESALSKVKSDPVAAAVVPSTVGTELVRMGLVYLLMGVVAGLVIGLARRAHGGRPWPVRLAVIGGVTAWMTLRGAIVHPLLYVGGPGTRWLADNVSPGQVDLLFALVGVAWLASGWLRHRRHPAWSLAVVGAVVAVALADNRLPADTPTRNEGPNVLVIGIDALRPDHLAHYGYHRDTAPNIESFLDRAVVFDNAVTPLPRTWPAYSSILTGTEPVTHGQRMSLPQPGHERPREGVPMITDRLKEKGYHTRFMTDDSRFSYMVPEHNFDVIDQPLVNIGAFALSGHDPHLRAFFTFLHGPLGWSVARTWRYNQAFGAAWTPGKFAEHVADSIAEASRHDRFFLTVHACTLHAPAARSWPYHAMYGMTEYEGPNRFRYRSTGSKVADGEAWGDAEIQRAEKLTRQQNLDLFDSGIAMVDETWARIARALDEGDLWDNTLVILLSDHGEDFLEDGARYPFRGPNHGYHPWGIGQTRVLLAIAGPGFDAGTREELVGLVDVAPTVARATGVDLHEAEGYALQDPVPARVLFGETGVSEDWYRSAGHKSVPFDELGQRYAVDPGTRRVFQRQSLVPALIAAKDFWALDDQWWLVRESLLDGPRFSLFRWHEDPTFVHDLAAEHPDVVQALAAAMRVHLGEGDVQQDGDGMPLPVAEEPSEEDSGQGAEGPSPQL